MAKQTLSSKKIAFLATDGVEQVELTEPWQAIEAAGAEVCLVSIKSGKIQGVHHDQPGDSFQVDQSVTQASAEDFDGLVLPGGVFNPDALRVNAAHPSRIAAGISLRHFAARLIFAATIVSFTIKACLAAECGFG